MKAKKRAGMVFALAVFLTAGGVSAGVVDQSQEDVNPPEGSWSILRNEYEMERNISLWQSFQAGMSEDFLGVELYWSWFSESETIDLCLYNGTGVDTNSLIHRETITFPEYVGQSWWLLSFTNSYPSLVTGNTYTFALEDASDDSASIEAGTVGIDSYANGIFWMQGYSSHHDDYTAGDTDWDVGFRTVMVPEPASAMMLIFGAGIGMIVHRARRWANR